MGYVAELQQFGPELTTAPLIVHPGPQPPEPAAVTVPAVTVPAVTVPAVTVPAVTVPAVTADAAGSSVPPLDEPAGGADGADDGADDDTADLSLAWARLTAAPGAEVIPLPDLTEPARPARSATRHRLRAAVLSCAALAVLAAAGVGYAALNQDSARSRDALPPGVQTPARPGDPDAGFTTGAIPGIDAVGRTTPTGAVTPSVSAGTPAQPTTVPGEPVGDGGFGSGGDDSSGDGAGGSGGEGATTPDRPGTPEYPPPPQAWPPVDQEPTQEPQPPVPPMPPPAQPDTVALAATLSRYDALPLGVGGYSATVQIANPGTYDVTGWRVTLTVPDGTKIRKPDGAAMSQHGDTVEFVPSGNATVPAGGSVTFTFEVRGVLAGDPSDCTINGSPCG